MSKKKALPPRATELEWLAHFYCNADFGPADSDIKRMIEDDFIRRTGKRMPEGYEREGEDE